LYERKWLHPVLDAFVRALPRNYCDIPAEEGTTITLIIEGDAGGEWTLLKNSDGWQLFVGASAEACCLIRLDQDTAWRLMTKGLSRADAAKRIEVAGEETLAVPFLDTLAVMA
jgi:hypothetical protein